MSVRRIWQMFLTSMKQTKPCYTHLKKVDGSLEDELRTPESFVPSVLSIVCSLAGLDLGLGNGRDMLDHSRVGFPWLVVSQ
jgi:hypothetical protein